MAKLLKPPTSFEDATGIVGSVFLAGSIEQGKAIDWQSQIWEKLKDIPGLGVLNPRRDKWDASWKQERGNNEFTKQVEWELSALESVDVVAMYFDPATKSPISLYELGLISHRFTAFSPKAIVCCPDGFWRKGNIQIVCHRYGHKMVDTLDDLIESIKEEFEYLVKLNPKEFDFESCRINWTKASSKKE
jgi:hypothetical protein